MQYLSLYRLVQGCIGGGLMATCINLTDSGFEPSLPRQKCRTSTTQPFGRLHIQEYSTKWKVQLQQNAKQIFY